jgi:hypothetical protein
MGILEILTLKSLKSFVTNFVSFPTHMKLAHFFSDCVLYLSLWVGVVSYVVLILLH